MQCSVQLFQVSPSSGVPIFRQIIDQVHALMAAGRLEPGVMLPSTRELAKALEVNMMTVSKAYSKLEADGVVERVRGRGMRVCQPRQTGTLKQRKREFAQHAQPAIHRGKQLGLTDQQILSAIESILREQQS